MLRFRIRMRPRKMAGAEGLGGGQEGRLKHLRKLVTQLIKNERIETSWARCDEARGYAEKLISLAIRNGDQHKPTMEMADYWLQEKELIHKLFKVLVPRYHNIPATVTNIFRLPTEYPGDGIARGVLELKGNPWPPVLPRPRDSRLHLTNILLSEARHEYNQYRHNSSPVTGTVLKSAPYSEAGSSVDGVPKSSMGKDQHTPDNAKS